MNKDDDSARASSPSEGWVRIDLTPEDIAAAFDEMRVTVKPGTPAWDEHQRWLKQLAERYGVHDDHVRLYLTWPSIAKKGSAYFMVPPAS